MSILRKTRKALKTIIFGDTALPEEFTVGIRDPQTEVSVWLHGMGAPIDVTYRQLTVCCDPFTLCIAFDVAHAPSAEQLQNLTLKFCKRKEPNQVLGEIGLRNTQSYYLDGLKLHLFEPRNCANYCLPKISLYAHYLLHLYLMRKNENISGRTMSFLHRRAAMVSFIRPHPTVLVSVKDELGGNIFPMNLMGDLGEGRFGFALKDSRRAAHLVEQVGRVVLSNVPLSQASVAYSLANNDIRDSISWEKLPFAIRPSSLFQIPVPQFAQRVRELQVEKVHRIGSHTFFIARILHDEVLNDAPVLSVIHGYYQVWRLNGNTEDLRNSVKADWRHKHGDSTPQLESTN